MTVPLSRQAARIPIGSFSGADGKPVPVFIEPSWYRYLAQEIYDRLGGASAPSNAELDQFSRSTMVEDDEEGEDLLLPGPKGEPGEDGVQGPATFLLHERESDPMPFLGIPGGLLEILGAGVSSGTYTPTLTNVANLDGSTAYQWMYLRIGQVVVCAGAFDADPTLTATTTQLRFSLPVASNIGAASDVSGVAFCSAVAGQGAAVLGDAANNEGLVEWVSGDVANQPMYAVFLFKVI